MTAHPLEALTADEIRTAVAALRASGRLDGSVRFSTVTLEEPTKADLVAFGTGSPVPRLVRCLAIPGPGCALSDAVVDVGSGRVTRWTEIEGVRPALLFDDSLHAIVALHENEEVRAALARRGIHDLAQLQIDPWPTGNFGIAAEEGRRIFRCLFYLRETPEANGYARPIEGLIATVDGARHEVLEVIDHGVVPMPPEPGSYYPEDHQPLRTDLRPLEIVQPDGPSFSVEGNLVRWQGWSLRVSMDPLEGLVLHTVAYDEGRGRRPVLHRASICEMVVPYGHPGPGHAWKNAFDVGEWGLGRMANSLTLGCDCLGEIRYFDAVMADERGEPAVRENASCMHEEDFGILWKHQDLHSGRTEVRRSRRLVISSIATVGNYEYGFYWYLYLDGTIQLEVKLTGIMSTAAVAPGAADPHAPAIAPGLAAPVHQHLFCARLDVSVDGPVNEVYEVDVVPDPAGPANPLGNAFTPVARRLDHEQAAQRVADPARSRVWKVVNPTARNAVGESTAYKLVPGPSPTLLAQADSSIARRAAFATRNLWVTRFCADERRAAGDFPNQHAGGDGLPRWTAADRSLVGTNVVVWHTFGVTHVPRPEDWPVMPVEYCGFSFVPHGFFDRNPALDLPPSAGHCHEDPPS
ncbi:MAG: primary-amine oxidase [Acidimicrobiales bacterium]